MSTTSTPSARTPAAGLYAISGNGPVYRLVGPNRLLPNRSRPTARPAPSFIGIRAVSRRVRRHRRGLISAWVAPCTEPARRPGHASGAAAAARHPHLDRVCSARFRPRMSRRSGFRVTVKADATYVAAISRKLTVRCATAATGTKRLPDIAFPAMPVPSRAPRACGALGSYNEERLRRIASLLGEDLEPVHRR